MSTDIIDAVLSGEPVAAPEPAPEASAEAPAQARDEQGRFASGTAEEVADTAGAQQPLTARETVAFYKAMTEEREKRQRLERELAQARARIPAEAPAEPDPQTAMQQALYAQRLDMSRAVLEARIGADEVAKVHAWAQARCDADPYFNQQMLDARLPYEDAYKAWRASQVLEAVKPDELSELEAFRARKAQQGQTGVPQPAAPAATAAPVPPAPPPRSLADAPGAGGSAKGPVAAYPGAAFEEVLGHKG